MNAEKRLQTRDLSYHNAESGLIVFAERTNAVFLTYAMRMFSGIGPRNALLVETCWTPELAVKVLECA